METSYLYKEIVITRYHFLLVLHEETHHMDSLVEKGRETTFYYICYNFQNLYILTGIPPSPSFSIEGSTVGSQAVGTIRWDHGAAGIL
jgi:hypothetical protein